MPFGAFAAGFPSTIWLAIHLIALALATYAAFDAFGRRSNLLGWGFTLFAFGELLYATYYLDLAVLTFAHAAAAPATLVAIGLVFAGLPRSRPTTHEP